MRLYENKERKGIENEKILTLTLPDDKATISVSKKSINKSISKVITSPIFNKFNINNKSDLKIFFEEPII